MTNPRKLLGRLLRPVLLHGKKISRLVAVPNESNAVDYYKHLRSLSIPCGIWFCYPSQVPLRFTGWVIPPFAVDAHYEIKANGITCEIKLMKNISQGIQDYFDRFGIYQNSRRYVFEFDVPRDAVSNEIAITCEFERQLPSVFYTYFWPNSPQVETPAFNMMRVARNDNLSYFTFMGYTQYRHLSAILQKYSSDASVILDWGQALPEF
jgi:hypothetical protein